MRNVEQEPNEIYQKEDPLKHMEYALKEIKTGSVYY